MIIEMSLGLASFLAIVQGLTEFLPISSSGHLVLFQKLFNLSQPPIFFDVMVHLGTTFAIIFFFRSDLYRLIVGFFKKDRDQRSLLLNLILASIPAGLLGLLLKPFLGTIFNSFLILAIAYFFTAFLLFFSRKSNQGGDASENLTWVKSLFIGIFQAIAILPGVSRSGSTIVGGIFSGLSLIEAFRFSFLLSIPAVLGASLLEIGDLGKIDYLPQSLLGALIAGVVGYMTLLFLRKILILRRFHYFWIYCLLLGLISIFLTFSK
jgi:undecaprenyl-diphosphatase